MLCDEVRHVMVNGCGFSPGSRILVGVSGGPDSLSLLDCLHTLGFVVIAAHYDHGLRPESAHEARFVQQAAARMQVAFTGGGGNVTEYARQDKQSIEEAARTLRYRFLFSQAHRLDCAAVAVGHTADDQVETVLMHFLRGAGLAGLRGMQTCTLSTEWDDRIPLLRPLLGVWRESVLDYCAERSLETVFDRSNLDTTYFRNRLRHELIPYLQSYNPQIKETLWRMSQAACGDYALLENLAQEAWGRSLIEARGDFVVLSSTALQSMETGLQRMVLRKAIAALRPGLRDITFSAVERAARFVRSPTNTRWLDLVAGLCLYASGDRLFIGDQNSDLLMEAWPQVTPGDRLELPVPGRLTLSGGWILEARFEDAAAQPWGEDAFHAWLDADALTFPLLVRTRRDGDRFSPLGMNGHSLKLSDFWINQQLPRPARKGWPLLCAGDVIMWIPGFRPAENCRLKPGSRRALHLWLIREPQTD